MNGATKKRILRAVPIGIIAAAAIFLSTPPTSVLAETPQNGWYEENGAKYWYENGVRQGTQGRGKEIYDPASDGWYWLDAVDGGKMATGKDVYQESNGGKWVRYDENGKMVKGWSKNKQGTYYFDPNTGAMVKGNVVIEDKQCIFDKATGIGLDCQWYETNGVKYWYEGGVRQGTEGRGKEIFDPASNAWYWLDAVDGGKMATDKDVYQESNGGKWVRYDKNGHMIKGESAQNGAWYRFDLVTGAMVKGWYTQTEANGNQKTYYYDTTNGKMVKGTVTIDGKPCAFDTKTGVGLNNQWYVINGGKYWYEKGVRQGTEGRGKEIYDPASKAWYWLDAVDSGKMAVSKDVYQESDGGKWVRYDSNGKMIKGWNTQNGKKYYFDWTTGAMAKGIVRIEGTDYYFDENSGVYRGIYEGGEVSYGWVNVKKTNYNKDGSLAGYTNYAYNDNGQVTRERVYNGAKRLMTEENYGYDSNNRVTSYSYRDYANRDENYTVTTEYGANGFISKETKKDRNGTVTEIRMYLYDGVNNYRTNIYNSSNVLTGYCTYTFDGKGNATKEECYDSKGNLTGYTKNTYYEYGGQSFLRSSIVYNANNKVLSGANYERTGYDLRKETVYTTNREVSEYTIYEISAFPDVDKVTAYQKESNTYDKNGNLKYSTTYDYELLEFQM